MEFYRFDTPFGPMALGEEGGAIVRLYLPNRPRSIRAVGLASGRDPIPILVPCHRMAESGNAPVRYAGGPELKTALLELEQPTG